MSQTCQNRQCQGLFNHLVRAGEKVQRDRDALCEHRRPRVLPTTHSICNMILNFASFEAEFDPGAQSSSETIRRSGCGAA
jgi:hypothetical protein